MNIGFKELPATGLAGLKRHFRNDVISGFSVSLIALPLCLGIAIASGVPPIAGIFTAIVGGIFASRYSGGFVSISGPAAGLIVINLAAVETLGNGDLHAGYPFALAAFVVAGLIVAAFSILKFGKLSDFFPSAAVHGMLAAIGVIIMVKQSYTALGVTPPQGELWESIMHLPVAFGDANPEVAGIALVALMVLWVHPRIQIKWIKLIPAPLWVLVFAIPMAHLFDLFHEHHYHFMGNDYELGPKHLVNLPNNLGDGIVFPDFGKSWSLDFWTASISIAFVTAIESLLSAKAVDSLDPWKRRSNFNRDLFAVGTGSAMAAWIGGLPMISEIVRSSANINHGARTQWANFFHGCFLLLFLVLLSPLIEQIPMAALASMLVFTGFRLASPREFRSMWKVGRIQFVVFLSTACMVILTDILLGIACGILLEGILQISHGVPLNQVFRVGVSCEVSGRTCTIKPKGALLFSNYLSFKKQVVKLASSPIVILDLAEVSRIDHTTMHNFPNLGRELNERGLEVKITNMEHLMSESGHPHGDHAVQSQRKLVTTLSKRQSQILFFAGENNCPFIPFAPVKMNEWDHFHILGGKSVVSVENKILVQQHDLKITVADLLVRTGAYFTEGEQLNTYLSVEFPGNSIPSFRLEEETMVDRLRDSMTQEDIDFDSFEAFSKRFMLRGDDSQGIRDFFTPERIEFFDPLHDLEVESTGNAILLRHTKGLLPPERYQEWIRLAVSLSEQFRSQSSNGSQAK